VEKALKEQISLTTDLHQNKNMHASYHMSVNEDRFVYSLRTLAAGLEVYILLVSVANLSQIGVVFL
jgi:hypothetical protein